MFQLVGVIFIVLGILNLLYPRAGWYMQYGWRFKNAEPSDAALVMGRISGIIGIAIGIFLFSGFSPFL
ncbi:DUF6199 family natural product biosynthesis protein [Paenibacillus glycanilyticus]|uniref:DUF6199 family natural product biosynthesis protein n=1 Tax=Paenibacillus glycanilyticus TaxID=126569 RepID=UPI003EBCD051